MYVEQNGDRSLQWYHENLESTTTALMPARMRFSLVFLIVVQLSPSATGQTLCLPPRSTDALSGNQVARDIDSLSVESREDFLYQQVMGGNIPEFMRNLIPVSSAAPVGGKTRAVTYFVTPDYIAVGSNRDYFQTPMTPLLAQRLADALECTLPTRKMVNDIYAAAPLKLAPVPIPPSAEMITVPVFVRHDSLVREQRNAALDHFPLGTLVAGTKKDVVISNKMRNELKAGVPRPVVIYGWHQLNGVPIQPLYNGHGETYVDYSMGYDLFSMRLSSTVNQGRSRRC
jgi:hypothetical protein